MYVPAESPFGLAVALTVSGAVHEYDASPLTVSQAAPEFVAAVIVPFSAVPLWLVIWNPKVAGAPPQ